MTRLANHSKVHSFTVFKRRGRKISGGLQAAPLSELRQGLDIWVKAKLKQGVKRNFGGVEHFIRGVTENPPPPPSKSTHGIIAYSQL
jgi:hypothetical protein